MMETSSVVLHFEFMSDFYQIGWALPSSRLHSLLTYAWAGCADPQGTKVALPVLFALCLVLNCSAMFSVIERCRDAQPVSVRPQYRRNEGSVSRSNPASRTYTAYFNKPRI